MDVSAQSPTLLTISPPDDYFDLYSDMLIISNTSNTTGYTYDFLIDPESPIFVAHRNSGLPSEISAAIYFSHPIPILSNPIFSNINDEMTQCAARVISLRDIFTIHVQGFDPPDNITPNTTSSLVGLGLDFFNNTDPSNDTQCSPNFETPSSDPLFTGKELLITIYQKSDKAPYYFSPRDNILEAQPIPVCSSTNFNETDQTLKGDNSMCYGANSTSMVIITKRLAGFYGAADTVTPPTNPVNLTIGAPSPDPSTPVTPDPTDPPLPAGTIKIPPPSGFPSGEPGGKVMRLADFSQNVDKQTAQYRPYAFPEPGDDSIKRQVTVKPRVGEVFVPGKITMLTNPFYRTINLSFNCYDIPLTNLTNAITIPNIQPSEPIGLGYVFDDTALCKTVYNLISDYPVLTDTELRVTLYGKYDKTPYYFSPRDNMTQAQSIPACSSTNFDTNNQTLKGDTKMCHGVNGTNMVIITKRFGGFYGAADTVTAPTNPIDLDSAGPSLAVTTSKEDVSGIGTSTIFNITSGALGIGYVNTGLIDTHGKHTFAAAGTTQKGHIYISPNTILTVNPLSSPFKNSDIGKDCVRGHVTSTVHADHDLPDDISEGVAYGFAYTNGTDTCNYNSNSMARQFSVDTPFRIVLYDQAGKQAYSYLPAAGITISQNIVECSSASFDDDPKIPIDSTTQCYEDVGDDLVIYSEVMQWYGAKTPSSGTTVDPPLPAGTIKIPPPDGFPTTFRSDHIIFTTSAASNAAQMTTPKADVRGKSGSFDFGDIFVQNGTRIVSNPGITSNGVCNFVVDSIYGFIWFNRLNTYPLPTNVQPNLANGTRAAIDEIVAVGFHENSECNSLLHDPAAPPLITDKELRVTIYGEYDKKPYFFSKRANMTEAQQIPACSSTNYDSTTQTLKDDTKMCAGVNGTNMVIITKRFTGFYGAADTITAPATPIDLDAGGAVVPPVVPPVTPDPSDLLTISGTIPSPVFTSTAVISDAGVKTGYLITSSRDGHTFTHTNTPADRIGSIFVPYETRIPTNNIFTTARSECDLTPIDIKSALNNNYVSGLAIPDNIKPNKKKDLVALGFDMHNNSGYTVPCSPNLESNNNPGPLLLDKALQFTLSGKHDKKPYHISPRDNITSAQQIAACSSDNFNTNNQTLKGTTEMCYGKNGTDMVILTKRLAGFYGAANSVTAVSSPDPSTPVTPGTPLTISPANTSAAEYRVITIQSNNVETTGSFDRYGSYTNSPSNRIGDIYIPPNTKVLSNPVLYDSVSCTIAVNTLKDIPLKRIQDLKVPDNIKPKQKAKTFAMGLDIYPGTKVNQKCSPDLEEPSTYPLLTDKPLRFTIYDKSDKKPYYISPRDNITSAQKIPACSSTNYDSATQTLKGDTKMCYGVDGDNLVIMTKRLLGFYGAANSITTSSPVNLDTAGSPIMDRVFVLLPDNVPDPVLNTSSVVSDSGVKTGYIDPSTKITLTHTSTAADRIGDIYIPSSVKILNNTIFPSSPKMTCTMDVKTVKDTIDTSYIPGLVIPSNINSSDKDDLVALGFDFFNTSKSTSCTPDLEAVSTDILELDKELRVTIYDKYDKKPYYISPRDNEIKALDIPKCTHDRIHLSNQSLKNMTSMCYGTYETHMVIITKRLAGFYGTANSVEGSTVNRVTENVYTSRDNVKGIGTQVSFEITTESNRTATIETFGKYTYSPAGTTQKGHIYIPPSTTISSDIFPASDAGKVCVLGYVLSSEYTPSTNAELFTLPDDISNGVTYGFGYSYKEPVSTTGCTLDGATQVDPPLDVNNVLQIVLYNQANKQGYSYLRTANITTSQYVPLCNAGNFDDTTKTLIGSNKHCYANVGDDLVIYTTIMQWYGAKPFDDDGMSTAPTFGTSPLTGEQLVTCGYKMDDTCRDITAYHVQYERDVIQTNTTHTFALKALAPNMIDSFTLAFGVPEIGSPVSAAEAYITAKLAVNYTAPSYYNIIDVIVHDPNNIIDYDIANTEIARVSCSGGTLECAQVTFPDVLFRETLYHEPFVVMITDTLLYSSINYMNEGILVTGTPLNKQPTISPGITVDTGDIRPTKLVLVRTDKVNDLWADAFGNTWSRNSFGNYVIVEYAPYAGTVPVCSDINDRLCAPFKAKLDWHNQRMIELRDSLYTAYTTKAYAEIDDIFTYEFGDMDSRTRTLINLGWLTE